jgi:hypothetical protein
MNIRFKHIASYGVITFFLFGCKKDPVPQFHEGYFGLEENRFTIYNVIEITHDSALSQHDTVYYQLKTVWKTAFVDNEGRDMREFERYKRDLPTENWSFKDLWVGGINGIRAEVVEENQRKIKLVFAPTLNKLWDANAENIDAEMTCYYRNIHKDTTVNGVSFDSTVVVEQNNFTSLIDTVRMFEVYAKGIGLIHKYSKDNHWQFGSNQVVNGAELYYEYVSSGYE